MSESTDQKSRFFASGSNFDFSTLNHKLGEKILSNSEFFAESSLLFRIFIAALEVPTQNIGKPSANGSLSRIIQSSFSFAKETRLHWVFQCFESGLLGQL